MANKILASSLDNFMILNTPTVQLPYVTFVIGTVSSDIEIQIKERDNLYGYSKSLVGTAGGGTTDSTFNTSGLVLYNFYECLKLNSIFYKITISNNTIKAYIDTSIAYQIAVTSGTGIVVGGTYASYSPSLPNKSCLVLQNADGDSIPMEKYHNAATVSFNLTSPFQKTNFKAPLEYNIIGYKVQNGQASNITIPYNSITVMPTTLTKFQNVNYDDYLYKGTGTVKFLTTQYNRYYNYGEWVGLSILTDVTLSDPRFKKCFYTNSGVFLEEEWTTQLVETNGKRIDIYDNFELSDIEYVHNKQVGYILVYAYNGMSTQLTKPIRFDVMPHCQGNNEIFFLNELGGVDSFNFTNTKQVEWKIGSQSMYSKTHTRQFTTLYDHEYVLNKDNKVSRTLSTNQISIDIAEWLNQLVKSKWTYKFLGMTNPRYKMIVVDKFDIQVNTNDDEFELSLEYHDADENTTI